MNPLQRFEASEAMPLKSDVTSPTTAVKTPLGLVKSSSTALAASLPSETMYEKVSSGKLGMPLMKDVTALKSLETDAKAALPSSARDIC